MWNKLLRFCLVKCKHLWLVLVLCQLISSCGILIPYSGLSDSRIEPKYWELAHKFIYTKLMKENIQDKVEIIFDSAYSRRESKYQGFRLSDDIFVRTSNDSVQSHDFYYKTTVKGKPFLYKWARLKLDGEGLLYQSISDPIQKNLRGWQECFYEELDTGLVSVDIVNPESVGGVHIPMQVDEAEKFVRKRLNLPSEMPLVFAELYKEKGEYNWMLKFLVEPHDTTLFYWIKWYAKQHEHTDSTINAYKKIFEVAKKGNKFSQTIWLTIDEVGLLVFINASQHTICDVVVDKNRLINRGSLRENPNLIPFIASLKNRLDSLDIQFYAWGIFEPR